MLRLSPKGFRQHLGPQTRSAHAKQHGMRELLLTNVFCKCFKPPGPLALLLDYAEPAQPLAFVGSRPYPGIACPEPAHHPTDPPRLQRCRTRAFELRRQFETLAVQRIAKKRPALARDGAEQLVERVGEELHALLHQLRCYLVKRDARFVQPAQDLVGPIDILL